MCVEYVFTSIAGKLCVADDGKIFVGCGVGEPFGPECNKGLSVCLSVCCVASDALSVTLFTVFIVFTKTLSRIPLKFAGFTKR